MTSKDFHTFLMQFSEKIVSVRSQESYSPTDLEQLDETIEGLLDHAQRVFSAEMQELLNTLNVDPTLAEMKETVEAHLFALHAFRTDHTVDQLIMTYQNIEHRLPLLDIPTAIQIYFHVPSHLTEYHFVTAYLARTDHYDIIQIYHFLRSRLN